MFCKATVHKHSALLSVINSQDEANGIDMKLGLTRLNHNMAVIQVNEFTSGWPAIGFMASMMSGQVAAA